MNRIRVLLVEDHELFREGLVGLINSQPDLEVVGQAGDGLEALTMARDLKPDLIVMDITMPLCNGVEATQRIRAIKPPLKARIMMLTILEDDENLFAAIRAGADGYLLKNANTNDFLRGLRGVLKGEAPISPKLATRLLQEFARQPTRPVSPSPTAENPDLTPRQFEILQLIATGAPDKEIAAHLSLSLHTVKTHVRSILDKLHTTNRRQAARLAREQGLLKDD